MAPSNFSVVAIALLSTAVCTGPAAAGGATAASPSWSGPFVGAQVGVSAAHIIYDDHPSNQVYQFADRQAAYSVYAGYDQEVGHNVVLGAEVGAERVPFDIAPFQSGGFGSLFSSQYALSASARGGILLDRDTLAYLRVGASAISTQAPSGFFDITHKLLPAALLGVGVDTRILGGLTARVEADYTAPLQKLATPDLVTFDPKYLKISTGLYWKLDTGADVPVPDVSRSRPAFNGVYGGVFGGFTVAQMDRPDVTPGTTTGPFSAQSGSVGIVGGYNARAGDFVAGIEASEQHFNNAVFYDPGQNSPANGSTKLFGEITDVAMVDGKAGLMMTPNTMLYLKVGGGIIRTTANPAFFPPGGGGTETLLGHQIGGGVETMLTDHAGLRLDATYTQADQGLPVNLAQDGQAELFPSFVTATAGFNWHF